MQHKVDNTFYVTEADGLPHLERRGRLVSRGRGRQLWANQRAEITHGVGNKRGVKRFPGSFQYLARRELGRKIGTASKVLARQEVDRQIGTASEVFASKKFTDEVLSFVQSRMMAYSSVSKASITVIGTSHIRRLRDDISKGADESFLKNFGLQQVALTYVCGGGWRLNNICDNMDRIVDSHPDYLVVQAAGLTMWRGERFRVALRWPILWLNWPDNCPRNLVHRVESFVRWPNDISWHILGLAVGGWRVQPQDKFRKCLLENNARAWTSSSFPET